MRAAVLVEPGRLVVGEQPRPQAGAGEVLVAVRRAGLCGSDLHFVDGSSPLPRLPQILGHELAGEVAALGPGVSSRAVGERVVIEPGIPCGKCFPCRRGKYNCCDAIDMIGVVRPGGFADFLAVPAAYAHPMPAAMTFEQGALVEPFSIGAQMLHRAQPRPGDTLALIGLGPIGLTALILLKAWHPQVRVIGLDLVPERIAQARAFGCDLTVNPKEQDAVKSVLEHTGGEGAAVVIECAGSPFTIGQTVHLVASGGRIVVAGVTFKDVAFPGRSLTKKEVEIFGSRNNAGQFPRCIQFLAAHPDIARRFVSATLPLARIAEAVAWARDKPNEVTKIILEVS
jgi:L-gulonate 5-dehydrogenase